MYREKFFFFLVLGSCIHLKISAKHADLEFSEPKKHKNDMSPVIFGKPLSEVDEAVKHFILSISKSTSKSLTQTLEKTSVKGDSIKDLVTISTKVVVEHLRSVSSDLGILKNGNRPEIIVPDKDENLSNNLIHNGLLLVCEIAEMLLEGSNLGSEFLFENKTVSSKSTNTNWKKPRYLDFIIFTDELIIHIGCMSEDPLLDDLKKAVNYGSAHSSNEVIDYLKKNIKKPPSNLNSNVSQSVCSAIEDIKPGGYEKCISDWAKIQSCFETRTKISPKSGGFSKFIKQLFPRKWVNSVVDLDQSCKIKKDQDFECKIRKRPFGTRRQLEFIVQTFTGKSITNRSPLSKVIRRFSKVVSKSRLARSIVQDCADYILIHHQGEKRKRQLKKKSETSPKEFKRYQKVSKSLDNFRNGVTEDLLNAVIESNQIPIYVEKSLKKARPKFFEWPTFSSALTSLSELINSVFDSDHFRTNENRGVSYDQNSQGLIEIREEFPDLKKLSSKEEALDNLLRTMNQVSSENRALTKQSAISAGLNNILLVLMFLETLSAVAILMKCNMEFESSNGGGSGPGQPVSSVTSGSHSQGGHGENEASEEMSDEDLRRKKRSFDPDSDVTFVSDLPDVGILPLNNLTDFFNFTSNENGMNDKSDSNYEITERRIIQYEKILVYPTESPKFGHVESFKDNYPYSIELNDTILKDGQKL